MSAHRLMALALSATKVSRAYFHRAIAGGFSPVTLDQIRDLSEMCQVHLGTHLRIATVLEDTVERLEQNELRDDATSYASHRWRAAISAGVLDATAGCPCKTCDGARSSAIAYATARATPTLAEKAIRAGRIQDPAQPPRSALTLTLRGVFAKGARQRLRSARRL